eukprot:TRINITY_DN11882_c2_g1_i2.p1 TRINITY_DN11882_c2_g1~~TRINITY_DN11882_c2_g1_i2.p1  ORF type:complete len:1232 (+),score=447.48 TRINITY_DN11882_c2_g1_i2:115-3810(+)
MSALDIAEIQDYLEAFYLWRDASKLNPTYLQSMVQQYVGRYGHMLEDLGRSVKFSEGWSDARRALKHFLAMHPEKAGGVPDDPASAAAAEGAGTSSPSAAAAEGAGDSAPQEGEVPNEDGAPPDSTAEEGAPGEEDAPPDSQPAPAAQPAVNPDEVLQTWFKENYSKILRHGPDIAEYVPGGHFQGFYDWADKEYGTDYFKQRRAMIELHDKNEPYLAPNLKIEIDALFGENVGAEAKVASEFKAKYAKTRKESRKWLERFYGKHQEDKLDDLDKILDSRPGEYMFELTRHALFRKYAKDRYLEAATYGKACEEASGEPWDIRNALIEFFYVRAEEKLQIIDQILETYPDREQMIDELLANYEPEYAATYAENKAAGKPVLFPPWRNIDYPRFSIEQKLEDGGFPDPPGETIIPKRGEKQPDIMYLCPEEYPDMEEVRRKENERLAFEAEESDAREAMCAAEDEQYKTIQQLQAESGVKAEEDFKGRQASEREAVEMEEAAERGAVASQEAENAVELDAMFKNVRDAIAKEEADRKRQLLEEEEAERRAEKLKAGIENLQEKEALNRDEISEAHERGWRHLQEEDARGRGKRKEFLEQLEQEARAAELAWEAAREAARAAVEADEAAAREEVAALELGDFASMEREAGLIFVLPESSASSQTSAATASVKGRGKSPRASQGGPKGLGERFSPRPPPRVQQSDFGIQTDALPGLLRHERHYDDDESSVGIPLTIRTVSDASSAAAAAGMRGVVVENNADIPHYTSPLPFPPPRRFWVNSTQLVAPCGMYNLDTSGAYCGAPFWVQKKTNHVLYLNGHGRWTIGKEEQMLDDDGWARTTERNDVLYPDQMEYEVRTVAGWDVDPCFIVARHPFGKDRRRAGRQRCRRCDGNREKLQKHKAIVDSLWQMAQDGDQLKYVHMDMAGLERDDPEVQLASLEQLLLKEHEKTPKLTEEWARLRRGATHDDIGNSLNLALLGTSERALALSQRRVEDMLAAVGRCIAACAAKAGTTDAERTMAERLAEDMGTIVLTGGRDAREAGVDVAQLEAVRREVRRHERDYGVPPMLSEEELELAFVPEATKMLLEDQAARLLPKASLLPTQRDAIQRHLVDQAAALQQNEARIKRLHAELVDSLAARDETIRTLQARLDAAHVALGLTAARGAWAAPRDPHTGYLAVAQDHHSPPGAPPTPGLSPPPPIPPPASPPPALRQPSYTPSPPRQPTRAAVADFFGF